MVRENEVPLGEENELKSAYVRGGRVKASLECASDHERESNKESMGMIIAEMHSSEIWTLKGPHFAARQDPEWRVKDTNRTHNISTQILICL